MKKELFTVRVDDYFPELCEITIPTLKMYAESIDAKFTVIEQRKYPEFSPTYEKMQIYELGAVNDYNILVDCDIAIKDGMYDVTELVEGRQYGSWVEYYVGLNVCNDDILDVSTDRVPVTNFMVSTKESHSIWKPLTISKEEALIRMKRPFVIDEYCVGRNVKKFKMTHKAIIMPGADDNLFKHANITTDNKDISTVLSELKNFISDE